MPGRSGELYLWGPAGALSAASRSPLTLPSGWVGDEVLVLTPAPDFLGERRLLNSLVQSLQPWRAAPLPLPAATAAAGGPLEASMALARAAAGSAAGGAHVLVVTAESPWDDPVGRAIVDDRAAHAGIAATQGGAGVASPDQEHRLQGSNCGFALQAVESGVSSRSLAQTPLDRLEAVMARLLAPGGCPWDREQTHDSLCPYVIEEAAEVIEAIERRTPGKLADELGDLLLQIAFHAALAGETGEFVLNDVVQAIVSKMLYRHPHVFADWQVGGAQDVLRNWDILKASEAAAAGEAGDPGAWRQLRKAAVRVSLAAIRTGFAAARADAAALAEARRDLADETAALIANALATAAAQAELA